MTDTQKITGAVAEAEGALARIQRAGTSIEHHHAMDAVNGALRTLLDAVKAQTEPPAVTDEMIERGARAAAIHGDYDGCFERIDQWNAQEQWERDAQPDEEPRGEYEDAEWWRGHARTVLEAALAVSPKKGQD